MNKVWLLGLAGMACLWSCGTNPQQEKNPKKEEVKKDTVVTVPKRQHKIIGYVGGYQGKIDIKSVKAKKLTHVNYAFANVKDGKAVLELDSDSANLAELQTLKTINTDLKILVSVGGWTWSKTFSDAALTDSSRQIFAQSAVDMLNQYQLDGIDIDWEYPAQKGDNNKFRPEDKQNFTLFLKALRDGLDKQGKKDSTHYLLTIASGANQNYLDNTEMNIAHQYLDFVNIMTYDFHGEWEPKTGHHTNLSIAPNDTLNISAEKAVDQHINAGIPVSKIVLGMAFYGRAWQNVPNENNGLNQSGEKIENFRCKYDTVQNHLLGKNGYVRHWDTLANAPFLYNDSLHIFVTYDDTMSIRKKCDFVKMKKMAGAMFWEYTEDSKTDGNSLVDVIDHELK